MRTWRVEVTGTFNSDTKARGKAIEVIASTGKAIGIEVPDQMTDSEMTQALLLLAEAAVAYVKETHK